jgi:hypothetical protein
MPQMSNIKQPRKRMKLAPPTEMTCKPEMPLQSKPRNFLRDCGITRSEDDALKRPREARLARDVRATYPTN